MIAEPSSQANRAHYRAEIDGLRALAVTAVIVNHLDETLLPSGYLGVDIFFVISGYVIASSLFEKPKASLGSFLSGFFARRMRRLAPALIVCVLTTSVLGWLLVPHVEESLQTGIAALFGASNIFLYLQDVDYFSLSRDLNLFTQTWSLGVEEQFYLLFPFIFWFSGLGRRQSGNRFFLLLMTVLALASGAACAYFTWSDPQAAYFLMPMRFWELAAGALLFGWSATSAIRPSGALSLLAFMLLIGALFVPANHHLLTAVAVVLLTSAVIGSTTPATFAGTLLSSRPVVYIGLISYPVYLWHWSVLSLSRWTVGIHAWTIPLQLMAILLLSALTYRYIEKPIRFSSSLRPDWRAIGVLASSSLVIAMLVAGLSRDQKIMGIEGAERRIAKSMPPATLPVRPSGLAFNASCVVNGAKRPFKEEMFDLCTLPPKQPGGQMIWALGDSHAGHLQGLLYALADRLGVGVHLIETSGVPFPMSAGALFEPRQRIFERILREMKPGDIVLVSRLFLNRHGEGEPLADLPQWSKLLAGLSEQLSVKGAALVVAGPPPTFAFDSATACWSLGASYSSCDVQRSTLDQSVRAVLNGLDQAATAEKKFYVFDQFSILCPPDKAQCSPFASGKLEFRDKDHLNADGAASLATPFIAFLRENGLLR